VVGVVGDSVNVAGDVAGGVLDLVGL